MCIGVAFLLERRRISELVLVALVFADEGVSYEKSFARGISRRISSWVHLHVVRMKSRRPSRRGTNPKIAVSFSSLLVNSRPLADADYLMNCIVGSKLDHWVFLRDLTNRFHKKRADVLRSEMLRHCILGIVFLRRTKKSQGRGLQSGYLVGRATDPPGVRPTSALDR